MSLYEVGEDKLFLLPQVSFASVKVRERADLQRLLRDQIGIIVPGGMVIAEEFGEWEDSKRRIDLLVLDKHANLVVVELKRTDDGGHMELQALRYAAMVSTLTFEQAVSAYRAYLVKHNLAHDAKDDILTFLDWPEPDEAQFAQDVCIVLVSAEFSKEITTTAIWLNQRGLDIRCIRLKPVSLDGRLIVDVQQIIPLPEAAEYQVRVREKQERERASPTNKWHLENFLAEIERNCGAEVAQIAKDLHDWSAIVCSYVWFGLGELRGTFTPILKIADTKYHLFVVRTDGAVVIRFINLHGKGRFNDRDVLEELRQRLNEVPGVSLSEENLEGKPRFELKLLQTAEGLQAFKNAMLWVINTARGCGV